jgi:hypothetical protein
LFCFCIISSSIFSIGNPFAIVFVALSNKFIFCKLVNAEFFILLYAILKLLSINIDVSGVTDVGIILPISPELGVLKLCAIFFCKVLAFETSWFVVLFILFTCF